MYINYTDIFQFFKGVKGVEAICLQNVEIITVTKSYLQEFTIKIWKSLRKIFSEKNEFKMCVLYIWNIELTWKKDFFFPL